MIGSIIDRSSFSSLLTRVEIGHIRIGSAGEEAEGTGGTAIGAGGEVALAVAELLRTLKLFEGNTKDCLASAVLYEQVKGAHRDHRDTQQMVQRNDQARRRPLQLADRQMGMGRAAQRIEILNARPSLPADAMSANQPMTAEQAATLKRLAEAAYELDAFKPNLTRAEADVRIAMLTAKLKLLDAPPHTL